LSPKTKKQKTRKQEWKDWTVKMEKENNSLQ
jgi:hypothetical protein